MKRDPLGFVGAIEALARAESTHRLKCVETGHEVFQGTETQCRYVQEGFERDLREGHPGGRRTRIEKL